MPKTLRHRLKSALPPAALHLWRRIVHGWNWGGKDNAQVFSDVYAGRIWGGDAADPFHSGAGSRDARMVDPYVAAMTQAFDRIAGELGRRPDIADIGCGDFHVGARLRPACARYVACDVVPALIAHHQASGRHPDVEFRQLDIARTPPPEVDVICVRQVFQHLGNADIAAALGHIRGRARWLAVSEHVPQGDFVPNRRKPPGPVTRFDERSGVDLAAAPFALAHLEARVICDVPERESGGRVVTTLYALS